MRIYKRMIRPMIVPPALQGSNCKPDPLYWDDYWINEEYEEVLKDTWEKLVKRKDSWASLKIEEKYVEIELPEPEPVKITDENFVTFTYDVDKGDIDFACEYIKGFEKVLPPHVGFGLLPSINIHVLDKDDVYKFIDEFKRTVDEKYGDGNTNEDNQ